MFGNRRKSFLVSAALVGGALLMTACQDTEDGAAAGPSATNVPAADVSGADAAGTDASKGADKGAEEGTEQGADQGSGAKDGGSAEGSGADAGDGTKVPVQQTCGANDISWSTRSESQAGGYILVMAKAKQGITCILPAALPTVAFGSDGTQAGPAEQAVGDAVTLSGATTAYAGVNPKTTNTDGGKELDSIIVGVGNEDPDPVSLKVGTITVDKPVVTNWHTAPADAVPSA
ncbi:hypothetical protein RB201_28720 [Streptomyces sp. S1A(2023)]